MGWQDDPVVGAAPASSQPAWMSDPVIEEPASAAPVSTTERAGAAAAGFNRGVTGLVGLPVDFVSNVLDLGKAGLGFSYHELTGKPIPKALEVIPRQYVPGSGEW